MQNLLQKLKPIDGKDYGAYQSLLGEYRYPFFDLIIGQIPKDPYAPPHTGIYRIRVKKEKVIDTRVEIEGKVAEIAARDFLARNFYRAAHDISPSQRGTAYSGVITVDKPGQTILDRSSVVFDGDYLEVRCFIGLPAKRRLINAKTATLMLKKELPAIVEQSLLRESFPADDLIHHIHCAEDSVHLRKLLKKEDRVSFIANGSLLARKSGESDLPLESEKIIPFESPATLQKSFVLPHRGEVNGMVIPSGVTLITGGGYHGKSTLLNAIQMGVYNHIPGDGRELVVTVEDAVKIRAYDGRNVEKTDISLFIENLPLGIDSRSFSSKNASGSTSQAAAIVEALEIGATALIMDEDTCATNFLIRDIKMQKLVAKADEPITTFIDRSRPLFEQRGVSTVLVLGGIGDYFEVADTVIQMKSYHPFDVTESAQKIASAASEKRANEGSKPQFESPHRCPEMESVDSTNQYGKDRIYSTDKRALHFGREVIDLNDLEQLDDLSQTRAIGQAINYSKQFMDGTRPLNEIVELTCKAIEEKGIDVIFNRISGHFAGFRKYELAMAINRLRIMRVK